MQPIDPESEWNTDPFSANVKNGRIYARGSSDNKGTLIARVFGAEDAIINNELNVNLKFFYEGEEEIGSPNLHEFVSRNKDLLNTDAVIMEGSQLGDGDRPVVALGVKGLLYVELKEEIGGTDLHSSNAAIVPNPAWNLIAALNSIYDGRQVLIPGFYDNIRPITDKEESILSEYPFDEEEMKRSFALKAFRYSGSGKLIRELFTSPTCNIDGIISGYNEEGSKTVTPRRASAKLDFRLVPDQDPSKIYANLKRYLKEEGHSLEIMDFGQEFPARTDPGSALARAMIASAEQTYGKKPVVMINSPGTQPMAIFTRELGIEECVSAIGVGDRTSRAHAPNESVCVENFYMAIDHTRNFLKVFR